MDVGWLADPLTTAPAPSNSISVPLPPAGSIHSVSCAGHLDVIGIGTGYARSSSKIDYTR